MSTTRRRSLLTPSDIAERAGVSRAAVSNWRKRHLDFPDPAEGDTKPMFEEEAVRRWLEKHGHQYKDASLSTRFVWSMDALRGRAEPDRIARVMIGTLQAVQQGATELPEDVAAGLPPEALAQVWEAASALKEHQRGPAADEVLRRTGRSRGYADIGFSAVASRLSTLLSAAPKTDAGATIYDPACGVAAALISIGRRATAPVRLIGHEINREMAELGAQRAELYGLRLELQLADTLAASPDPELQADLILAEPPFGLRTDHADTWLTDPRFEFGVPPKAHSDLAWVQHCIYHLAEGGRAHIILPVGSTFRSGSEQRIRAELLRRGCVEAVVGLPPGMAVNTGVRTTLWVLRRPGEVENPSVLLVDASEQDHPEQSVHSWLHDPGSLEEVPHAQVPVADLLAAEAQLNPERWMPSPEVDPAVALETLSDAWNSVTNAVNRMRTLEPLNSAPAISAEGRLVTVHELIQQGVIELSSARAATSREKQPGTVYVRDIRTGQLPAVQAMAAPRGTTLTEPGDVLVSASTGLRALVDEQGGHILGAGLLRLRVLNLSVLLPEYLAACMSGAWNTRFMRGTVMPRLSASDAKQFEVPLRPLAAQQSIVERLREVQSAKQHAQEVSAAADTAAEALISLVRHSIAGK